MINEKYGFDTTGMTEDEIEEIVKDLEREECRDHFIENLHGNEEELLSYIENKKYVIRKKLSKYEEAGDKANVTLFSAILEMVNSIEKMDYYPLMELDKEDGWSYELMFSTEGIALDLIRFDLDSISDDTMLAWSSFTKMLARAKVLSVSEYAQKYGVEPVTVRQWIRRGKLRSARKKGSEWYIPELATPSTEIHYSAGDYSFSKPLSGVPEEFSYLNGHQYVHITQKKEDRKQFEILFWDDEEDVPPIIMTTKEREKLEYYLLGHPDVKATETMIDL